jgi:hypothetical protein
MDHRGGRTGVGGADVARLFTERTYRDIFRVLDSNPEVGRYDQAGMSEARRRVQSPRRSYKRPGYEALFNEACSNLDAVSHGGGG